MRDNAAILPMLVALAILFSAAPPAHSDEVNLSRNRVTAVMPAIPGTPNAVFQAVPPTLIAAFCEDGDGCTLRLQMVHDFGDFRADQRLLFKNGARWLTGGEVNSRVDGDNDAQGDTFSLQIGGTDFCDFSDAEPSGSDNSAGFSVVAVYTGGLSTPGFSCLLTVID